MKHAAAATICNRPGDHPMNLPDSLTLDRETARDDDAPQWSDLDAPPKRVRLAVVRTHERARTERVDRLSRRTRDQLAMGYSAEEHASYERPRTRGDCLPGGCNEQRPCPWVSCTHHLAYDVLPTGSIKDNWPDVEVEHMEHTCALDVADHGGATLDEVGAIMNITRERVRQTVAAAVVTLWSLGLLRREDADDAFAAAPGEEEAFHGACRAPDLSPLRAVRFSRPEPVARAEWRAPRPTDAALERDAEYMHIVATNARALDPRALRGPGAAVCGPVHRVPATRWREAPEDLGPASRHPLDEAREALDAQETAR